MKTIYKYPLTITDEQVIELPVDHDILTVQSQNGSLCLWAIVDREKKLMVPRKIHIIGTGNPAPQLERYSRGDMQHINTVQMGSLVWHVFIDL